MSPPLPPPSRSSKATMFADGAAGVMGGAAGGDVGRVEGEVGTVDDGLQVVELGGQGFDPLVEAVDAQGMLGQVATAESPPGRGAVEVRRPAQGGRGPVVAVGRGAGRWGRVGIARLGG